MKQLNTTMKSRSEKTSLFVPIAFCVFVCCVFLSMIFVSCRHEESKLEKALKAYQKFYKRNETLSADLLLEIQISALTGYDLSLQADVVEAFKELGDKGVFPNLINALNNHNSITKGYAAEALGELGDKDAVPHLINALNDNDNYSWVRSDAAEALGKLGDNSAFEAFDKCPQR